MFRTERETICTSRKLKAFNTPNELLTMYCFLDIVLVPVSTLLIFKFSFALSMVILYLYVLIYFLVCFKIPFTPKFYSYFNFFNTSIFKLQEICSSSQICKKFSKLWNIPNTRLDFVALKRKFFVHRAMNTIIFFNDT